MVPSIPSITEPIISYFVSGESVLELTPNDLDIIRSKSFLMTTNYAGAILNPRLNIHSDVKVTEFLAKHFSTNKKTFQILSRKEAFGSTTSQHEYMVDWWFESRRLAKGNFTILWALAWLLKNYPDKTILLFGADFYGEGKFYDRMTDFDKLKRGERYSVISKNAQCLKQLEQIKSPNIINCNPKSCCNYYMKKDWREILAI